MSEIDLTAAVGAGQLAGVNAGCRCAMAMTVCLDCASEAAVRAAAPVIERAVRERMAAEIQAHADEFAPADGNEAQRRVRRHLEIAARVAAPDPTLAEIVSALENAVWCEVPR